MGNVAATTPCKIDFLSRLTSTNMIFCSPKTITQVCHRDYSSNFLSCNCGPFPHRRGSKLYSHFSLVTFFFVWIFCIFCLVEGGAGREPCWFGGSCRLLRAGNLQYCNTNHLPSKNLRILQKIVKVVAIKVYDRLNIQVLLLVLVNLYFYATSTRQIGKQLVYNRSMQHFQVVIELRSSRPSAARP